MKDSSISSALAVDIPQFCAKPSIWCQWTGVLASGISSETAVTPRITPTEVCSRQWVNILTHWGWAKWSPCCKRLFSCDQAAIWLVQSVRLSVHLSVCPSVRHTFFTMFPSSYHHEIFRSYYHGQKWCLCKRSRSKVKVTEVNTQLNRFRTLNSSLNSYMAMKSCTQLGAA